MSDAPSVTTKSSVDTARVVKLALVASDAAYAGHLATPGMPLAAYRDTPAYDNPQPFQTPPGFVVDRVFEDPTTGYKAVAYVNRETNELLFGHAGTDGPNKQDWASNALHIGINQWENNKVNVLGYVETRLLADPTVRLIVPGQSLGGGLAGFLAHDVLRDLSQNPDFDPSRVSVVTFNGSAPEYALKARAADNPNDPSCAYAPDVVTNAISKGALILDTAMEYDRVSYLGGRPLSGRTLILDRPLNQNAEQYNWTPNPNATDPTYAHRIETGLYDVSEKLDTLSREKDSSISWSTLTSKPDLFTDSNRAPLNVQETQAVGNWLAGTRSGQYGETEGLIRIGLGGVGGVILSSPGESGGALASAFQKLGMEPQLANVGGYGAELILKGLCVAAPVPCALTLAAAHGTADLIGMLERSGLHDAAEQLRNQNFVEIGKTPDGATRRIELGNAYDDPQLIDEYSDKTVTISLRDQSQTIYDKTTQEVMSLPGLHIERDSAGGNSAIVLPSGQRVEFDPQQDALSSKPDGSWTVQRSDGSSIDVEPISGKPFQYTAVDHPAPVEADTTHPIEQEAAIAPPPAFEADSDTINPAVPQTAPTLPGASSDQARVLENNDSTYPIPPEPAITPPSAPPGSNYDNDLLFSEPASPTSGSSPADSGDADHGAPPQSANNDRLTAGAINSATNLILAIEHGDTFAAVVSGVSLANNLSKLNNAGNTELDGAGNALGTVASALNLYNSLESGDVGGIIVSSAGLLNVVASEAISNAIGMAFGEVVPLLGIVNSLAHGDVVGAAIGAVAIAFPVAGAVLMVANLVFGGLFGGNDDIPTRYGDAEARWDSAGQVLVSTTRDDAGGGATAVSWMNSLLGGLVNELASRSDAQGQPLYGLDPSRLPGIGYAYDPDTDDGYLRLSWTAADGTVQYRQYDTSGSRHDAQTRAGVNDLARDFFEHAAAAIVPAWEAQTLFQQQGSTAPAHTPVFTGEVSADGAHVTRTVLTLGSGSTVTTALDLDLDGYLEQSAWTTAAVLAVDLDGNGKVSADELVDGRTGTGSRNSLAVLDANGDGALDSRDPAFAALTLWIDANGNGVADEGEVTAVATSISTITFADGAIMVTRSDGTTSTLTRTDLTGDTRGVSHALTQDGLYETQEGGGTTLHAVNQHTFDGDAAHQHGGEANPDAHGKILIDAGDARIRSLGKATAASSAAQTSIQGDALLHSAGTGTVIASQTAGGQAGNEADLAVVSDAPASALASIPNVAIRLNAGDIRIQSAPSTPVKARPPVALPPGLAFVPNATTHPARALEQVTAEMISSATNGPFSANIPLAGITVAALPLVFPSVVSAVEASTDAMTQPPATPGSLTEALLQDVLAGRRHDDMPPVTEASPVAVSVGMVTSSTPGKRDIPAPHAPSGAQVALPTQVIATWHSTAAETTPGVATPPASQTPGLTDWVSTPQAPKTAGVATTASSTIPEGGTNPTGTVPSPQARPPAAFTFINHAPDVQGEQASSPEDTGLIISPADLLANDSDQDGATVRQTLALTTVGNTTHGSVTLTGDQIHFSPDSNYFGPASFDYTVSDGAGGESLATFALNILPVNDAPQAVGETTTGREDTGISFTAAQLLINEVDADGDPLSIVRVGNGQHGTVSMNGQGDVNFLPDANYSGPAGFDYWVSDGQGGEAQAHVAINLASVNDAPMAGNDILGSHAEDMTILIASADLLRNDRDADSATLTITAVSDALHGTVEQLADGTIRFTPDANYNGPAGFRYTISDGDGGHTTALAVLTISPVNDAPVAQGETASGDEDHEMIFPAALLLANDIDADTPYGDQLTITAVSLADPATGSVRIADDGSVHFTPRPDYAGPTVLTYQISDAAGLNSTAKLTLTVLPVNDAPVVIDEAVAGTEDTTLQFTPPLLLANDQDIDNTHAELFIHALGPAQHGSVRWQNTTAGPSIEFTPDADFSGEAGFVYTVADGSGGESQGRVRVNVANVNDPPIAHDDRDSGLEDTPLTWTWSALTGNDIDVDGDALSIIAVGNAHGGTVAMTNNQVSFTPDAEYSGQGGFDYTINDGHGGMSSAHVALEISAVNDAPTVVGETIQGMEETPLDIDPAALLVNDSDIDSPFSSLKVTTVGGVSHGTVTQLPDGTLRFVPDVDFVGTASFNYIVADDAGATTGGTAIIHVANINDAPTVTGETITSAEDVVLNLKDALLANDTDVDTPHGALSISAVANAEHCTVSINSDGSVTFRPEANYSGHAAFDYTVSDAAGGQGTATAKLVITPVNDAPLVNNEWATANEDSIIHFSAAALLANDTDLETPGSLHVAGVGAAHGGQVSQSGDDIVFTPDRNFNGTASFSYTVADPEGALGQGRVDISYLPMNDAPVVNDELFHGRQNVAITITNSALLQNDDDDGGRLNLRVGGAYSAYGGTLSNSQDGVIFQPDTGFSGIGSFNYVVTDGEGASSIGYAQIDFSQANRNPVATDDSFSGDEDVVFNISTTQLLANDSDADDSGALAVTGVGGAIHGTVRLDSTSGSVIFTPDANYNGEARFNYTVADPYGGSTQATAFLDVKAVNDAPVIDRIEWNAIDARFPDQNVINSESMLYETIPGEHVDDPYRASGRIIAHDPDEDGGTLSYSILAFPIHGKAWTNQYTHAGYAANLDERGFNYENGTENISLSQFGAGGTTPISQAWISESASWQYYSTLGDPYTGADPFTIRVSDAQGAHTDVSITTNHLGSSIKTGGGGGCPVVLDLDNDGIELLTPEDSSIFADLNGDGWKDRIGWVAPGDGVLAYDANGDGQIDVMDEVSFVKYKDGARTDLEGLAGLDSSGDGLISSADERWSRLGVVSGDAHQDNTGKISAWSSLDSVGITSISLNRQGTPHLDHGNVVFGTSTLTFADGHTSEAGDVMFAGAHIALPDAVLTVLPPGAANSKGVDEEDTSLKASDEIARIRQQALLFNQASATVEIEATAAPIAYVPPQTEAFDACVSLTDSPIVPTSTELAPV